MPTINMLSTVPDLGCAANIRLEANISKYEANKTGIICLFCTEANLADFASEANKNEASFLSGYFISLQSEYFEGK